MIALRHRSDGLNPISSNAKGILSEVFHLTDSAQPRGSYVDATGAVVGYALNPGYETYRGQGWYGVISQAPARRAA